MLNFIHQYLSLFILAEFTFLNHVFIGLFPSQIWSNKETDKLFVSHTLMPKADKAFLEIFKILTGTNLGTILLNLCSQPKAPSSGIEETCSMGSILDIIRKCQCLLIIVELGCKHLGNTRTNLSCTTKTHQGQATTAATARAYILLVILSSRSSDRIRNQNLDHFCTTVYALIRAFFTSFHL